MALEHFLWGAATSAFQYEGAQSEDGKGWSSADERCKTRASKQADASIASDGYHHMEEDVFLMKELGIKSYRFSISWTRVIPDGDGPVNPAGIAYYKKLISMLKEAGIEPVITLLHFDIPWALIEKYGGFTDERCIDAFVYYCRVCFENYRKEINYWITINEQNVMIRIPDMLGLKKDDPELKYKLHLSNRNMFLASARAIILCHEMCPHAMIGPDVSYPTVYPLTCKPQDVALAYRMEERNAYDTMEVCAFGNIPVPLLRQWNEAGVEVTEEMYALLKQGTCDYLGVNWYCTSAIESGDTGSSVLNIGSARKVRNPYLEYTDWGWSYDPTALYMALHECWIRYRKPIMICENGWSAHEQLIDGKVHDTKRIEYLRDHINVMKEAVNDGIPLIGYQYWSFVDILSSSDGFAKRYGLIYVDREDFDPKQCRRIPKDSFYYYQKVIREKGNTE